MSLPTFSWNLHTFVKKVSEQPALPVKSWAACRHKLLPIANFPCNYSFGPTLEFTDYPEEHKPELSECQKREFPRLDSFEKTRTNLKNKRNSGTDTQRNKGQILDDGSGVHRDVTWVVHSQVEKVSRPHFGTCTLSESTVTFQLFLFLRGLD